ncbi:MAG: arginine decarboxylase, partial [Phycisphaerales bacterium JB041]
MTRLAQPSTGEAVTPTDADSAAAGWSAADALQLYGIPSWGGGYFGINELGHLAVQPEQDPGRQIDLHELIEGLAERDIGTPVMI